MALFALVHFQEDRFCRRALVSRVNTADRRFTVVVSNSGDASLLKLVKSISLFFHNGYQRFQKVTVQCMKSLVTEKRNR